MKKPAKSVMERLTQGPALDRIALPLIPQVGIVEAYRQAMVECDAQIAERFPATRKEPPFRLTPPRA